MHARQLFVSSAFVVLAVIVVAAQQRGGAPAATPMMMTVAGFSDGGQIPVKYSQAAPGVATG